MWLKTLLDVSGALNETKTFAFRFSLVALLSGIIPVVVVMVIIITVVKHRKDVLSKHYDTTVDDSQNAAEVIQESHKICEYCGSVINENQTECSSCGAKKSKK